MPSHVLARMATTGIYLLHGIPRDVQHAAVTRALSHEVATGYQIGAPEFSDHAKPSFRRIRLYVAAPQQGAGTRPGRHRDGLDPRPLSHSSGLDFDRSRHRGSRRGDSYLEHAVRVLRLNLGGVDAFGEREAPLAPAVRDLADEVVLVRGV